MQSNLTKEFLQKITKTEPKWMQERRLQAFDLYESLPMPHLADDDVWRRTVDMRTQDYWRRTRRHLRGFDIDSYQATVDSNGNLSGDSIEY